MPLASIAGLATGSTFANPSKSGASLPKKLFFEDIQANFIYRDLIDADDDIF